MDTYSVPFVSGLEGFHCIPSLGLIFSSLPPPSPSRWVLYIWLPSLRPAHLLVCPQKTESSWHWSRGQGESHHVHVSVMWLSCEHSLPSRNLSVYMYTHNTNCPLCVMWLSHDLCRGQVIASMGDALEAELSECLPIFVDRLRNEITRLTAVRAVTLVARYVTTAPGKNIWASVIKFIFSDRHLKLTSTSFWWVKILSLLGLKIVWKF